MATKGLTAEKGLLSALRFHLIIADDPVLDQVEKIDFVVVGSKIPGLPHLLSGSLAVQVTTRLGDGEKRVRFLRAMQSTDVQRSAFLEMDTRGSPSPKTVFHVLVALLSLFFDKNTPAHALVAADERNFETNDLEKEVEKYLAWLKTAIKGKQRGFLTFWRWLENEEKPEDFPEGEAGDETAPPLGTVKKRGYGFISLQDPRAPISPNSSRIGQSFYVPSPNVSAELAKQLEDKDGNIVDDRVVVDFFDGGVRRGQLRKVAVSVVPLSPK